MPRVSDVYASLPSLTGKIELEYEGELKGAEHVARELVRAAVATVFDGHAGQTDTRPVVEWFERGGTLDLSDTSSAAESLAAVEPIEGFERVVDGAGRERPRPRTAARRDRRFRARGPVRAEEDQPHRRRPAASPRPAPPRRANAATSARCDR